MVIRVISVLAGIVLAVVMVWFTPEGKRFHAFCKESLEEARRVIWPSRKETMQTTGIVFAFVLVMAIFLWMVDAGLLLGVKYLMGQEGEWIRNGTWFMPTPGLRRACSAH